MVAFLNSADRSVIFAVMPQLRTEFQLTATQLALISSVFFWIYAIAAFLSGRLSDTGRRSRVVVGGLMFWSVATGVASLSTGFAMFIALRGFVALGESTYYPAATALISDWHSRSMRSRALSLHQTGVFAGAGLGGYIAGEIADRFGWRIPFVVFGGLGLALGALLLKFLRDRPVAHVSPPSAGNPRSPLSLVLAQRPALYLCLIFFLSNGAATGITVWAPTYVHDVMGLNLGSSALYGAASINLAGFLAVPFGGLLADWLAGRSAIGRFYALIIGLGIAAVCLVPFALAKSAPMVGVVLLCSSIGKGLFDGCIYAAMHDVVPPQARATAVGLMTMLGFFGAGLMPLLVAQSASLLGMAAGLASLAVLYFIAVGILLATRGSTRTAVLHTRQLEEGI
ncbi:MAG: transporter, family, hexuronate transporter [Gammaproteobacteria bacterium]|jgi:MFS family permease|nr:transporter, family, hexuronate transporter [Gammaproteobacteria bacterium]